MDNLTSHSPSPSLLPPPSPPDGESHPGAADSPAGAGEGERAVQGLLQPLHRLPEDQDEQ